MTEIILTSEPIYEFRNRLDMRINEEISKKIRFILSKNPSKYDNQSHLIRCLIISEYNRIIYKRRKVVKNE